MTNVTSRLLMISIVSTGKILYDARSEERTISMSAKKHFKTSRQIREFNFLLRSLILENLATSLDVVVSKLAGPHSIILFIVR